MRKYVPYPYVGVDLCSTHSVVFIAEITARAFIIADSNKRRTLSRADIAKALSKSDQFDFLIDIVPREEGFPGGTGAGAHKKAQASASSAIGTGMGVGVGGVGVGVKRDEVSESNVT